MDLETEKNLVEKAKKEPDAFVKLYELNYSNIFGYILKRTADIELAQDITSETFFKALKNINQFKWHNISFSSWLYRIASNEIVNYYRKNKYKKISLDSVPDLVSLSNPHQEFIEAEKQLKEKQDFLKIQKEIAKLPKMYQEVIVLKFFEKKKITEICEILGKKEGTVKSLIHRAIQKLKELV